jgi:hypothetical protein
MLNDFLQYLHILHTISTRTTFQTTKTFLGIVLLKLLNDEVEIVFIKGLQLPIYHGS